MTKLEIHDLNKIYKTKSEEIHILKNINFTLEESSFVSIQGKSGSGKTTLLNIMGMLDSPTDGIIKIGGENINKFSENEKNIFRNEKIGFVFQFHYLLNEFTALENVLIPAFVKKNKNKEKVEKRAKEILEMLELSNKFNNKPHQLSGGEKQRVAIARAMINSPDIILADEPTGNLDNETSIVINNIFKMLNKEYKQSIVVVTHSLELANMADKKYKIENGQLIQI